MTSMGSRKEERKITNAFLLHALDENVLFKDWSIQKRVMCLLSAFHYNMNWRRNSAKKGCSLSWTQLLLASVTLLLYQLRTYPLSGILWVSALKLCSRLCSLSGLSAQLICGCHGGLSDTSGMAQASG